MSYYDYGSSYYYRTPSTATVTSSAASASAAQGFLGFLATVSVTFWLICIALSVVAIIGKWKMYKKAGVDGWESLIAGHNFIVEMKLGGIPTYWYFLIFVPFGIIAISCWKQMELAKSFGKSTGFGIGLILLNPIFTAILGFGKAQYLGPHYQNQSATAPAPVAPVANTEAAPKAEEKSEENK